MVSGWNPAAAKPKEDDIFEGRNAIQKRTTKKKNPRGIEDEIMKNLKKLTALLAMKNLEEEHQREIQQNQQSSPYHSSRNIKVSNESAGPSSRLPTINHEILTIGSPSIQNDNIVFRKIQMRKRTKNFNENDKSINDIIHVEPMKPVVHKSPRSPIQRKPVVLLNEKVPNRRIF